MTFWPHFYELAISNHFMPDQRSFNIFGWKFLQLKQCLMFNVQLMFTVQGMQQVHRQTRASVTSGSCSGGSPAPRTVPNIQFLFLVFLYFVFCTLYFVICIFYCHLYWKSFAGWKRSASNFDQNLLRMASAAAHIDRQHWRLQRLKILPLARCSWCKQHHQQQHQQSTS